MKINLLFLLLCCAAAIQAQELKFTNGCNFHSDKTSGTYTLLGTTEEAENIVDEILSLAGITQRPFTLQAANVDNAQANERSGTRYVLYSHKFIEQFKQEGKTKWTSYFVFAHEIGHHVLGHRFSETEPAKRRKMEREADEFAAVALARLRAPREDALTAVRNLKTRRDEKPQYYPEISVREEAISIAFDKENKKIIDKAKGTEGAKKLFIALDPAAQNRWNVATGSSAYITDEKVVVSYNLPPQSAGRTLNIVLCSVNPNMRVNTLVGAGTIPGTAGNRTLEWNYQMDQITQAMASQPNQLRLYVYDMSNMPKAKIDPLVRRNCLILAGAGAATGLVGYFVPYRNALSQHDDYKQYLGENDAFYTEKGTTRTDFYKKADRQYIGGQVMMFAGGAAVLGSAVWTLVAKNKARRDLKNTRCAFAPQWNVQPVWMARDAAGLGLNLRF